MRRLTEPGAASRRISVDTEAGGGGGGSAQQRAAPPPPPLGLPPLLPRWADQGPWAVVGTYAALVAYGLLQERVMSRAFGDKTPERFAYSAFLVAANRLFCCAAVLALHVARAARLALAAPRPRPSSSSSSPPPSSDATKRRSLFLASLALPPPAAPLRCYARVALSNAAATLCQYEALRFVSFIAASLAKTAKALPVLLWGLVPGRRKAPHTAREAGAALGLALGCALFALGGGGSGGAVPTRNSSTSHNNNNNNDDTTNHSPLGGSSSSAAGALLLAAYLAADGWTSSEQERLYGRHGPAAGGRMDEGDQLLHTSACSAALSFAAAALCGQLFPALAFLRRHGDAALAVAGLSAASAAAQLLIGAVVRRHGALVFAQVMTSRQLASVLLSAAVYGHALQPVQWLGVAVAFGAIAVGRRRGGGGGGGGGGGARGGGSSVGGGAAASALLGSPAAEGRAA